MKQIGANEARAQLSRLLREVEQGETVTITRRGRPVARLVRVRGGRRSVAETIKAIEELRKGNRLDGLTTKELIEEGRRH